VLTKKIFTEVKNVNIKKLGTNGNVKKLVTEVLAASKSLKRFFRLRILSSKNGKNGFTSQFIYRKRQRKKRKNFTV
jgi:hypothetical protein